MSTLPMEGSADNRVTKLLEMARNATNTIFHKEDALKCYKAVLQLDPNNVEADLYVFLLTTRDTVKVYDPQISEYYSTLISKFHALLKNLKENNLSHTELREAIERVWHDIDKMCFTSYTYHTNHLEKEELLKEIQGHAIRLEAVEKIGDCVIAEFPKLEDIAIEVWGYEVGVTYQAIARLKEETKYDPEAIDVWEGNKMRYDINKVVRKILEIDYKYLSPYTDCPQEIKEYFKQADAKKEAAEKMRQAKSLKIFFSIIVGIAATIFLIWSFVKLYDLFDGFIIFVLFGGMMWIGGIVLVWVIVNQVIEGAQGTCRWEIKHLMGE